MCKEVCTHFSLWICGFGPFTKMGITPLESPCALSFVHVCAVCQIPVMRQVHVFVRVHFSACMHLQVRANFLEGVACAYVEGLWSE